MKMLKKMGWQEGQPLGKKGEGHVEPIALDVKVDRSGKWLDLDQLYETLSTPYIM